VLLTWISCEAVTDEVVAEVKGPIDMNLLAEGKWNIEKILKQYYETTLQLFFMKTKYEGQDVYYPGINEEYIEFRADGEFGTYVKTDTGFSQDDVRSGIWDKDDEGIFYMLNNVLCTIYYLSEDSLQFGFSPDNDYEDEKHLYYCNRFYDDTLSMQ